MKQEWFFAKGLFIFERLDRKREVEWHIESTVIVRSTDRKRAFRKAVKALRDLEGANGINLRFLGVVDFMDLFDDEIGDGTEVSWDVFRMHRRTVKRKGLFLTEADVKSRDYTGGKNWRKVLARRYREHRSKVARSS